MKELGCSVVDGDGMVAREGKWLLLGSKGRRRHETNFKNGKKDGVEVSFSEDGKKMYEKIFVLGVLQSGVYWHLNGKLSSEVKYADGLRNGEIVDFFDDGKTVQSKMTYVDDKVEGVALYWHRNGMRKRAASTVHGKLHGLSTSWYDNGVKESEGTWAEGEPTGDTKSWTKDGVELHFPARKQ